MCGDPVPTKVRLARHKLPRRDSTASLKRKNRDQMKESASFEGPTVLVIRTVVIETGIGISVRKVIASSCFQVPTRLMQDY